MFDQGVRGTCTAFLTDQDVVQREGQCLAWLRGVSEGSSLGNPDVGFFEWWLWLSLGWVPILLPGFVLLGIPSNNRNVGLF